MSWMKEKLFCLYDFSYKNRPEDNVKNKYFMECKQKVN